MILVSSVAAGALQLVGTKLWAARWEDVVGGKLLQGAIDRMQVAQVGLEELDLVEDARDVFETAAPAMHAGNLNVGMVGEQILR